MKCFNKKNSLNNLYVSIVLKEEIKKNVNRVRKISVKIKIKIDLEAAFYSRCGTIKISPCTRSSCTCEAYICLNIATLAYIGLMTAVLRSPTMAKPTVISNNRHDWGPCSSNFVMNQLKSTFRFLSPTKCWMILIIPHATSCRGYNVFDPSVSQSVCQSGSQSFSPVFLVCATPMKRLNRISWIFVVMKDLICRCAYPQTILIQFFFSELRPFLT